METSRSNTTKIILTLTIIAGLVFLVARHQQAPQPSASHVNQAINSPYTVQSTSTVLYSGPSTLQIPYAASRVYFSNDHQHVAVGASTTDSGAKSFIIDDTKISCDDVDFFNFSPDSKRYALVCYENKGGSAKIIVNGKVVADYDRGSHHDLSIGEFLFSPDSKHIAYKVFKGHLYIEAGIGEEFIVIDGKPTQTYEYNSALGNDINFAVSNMQFSPDSQHFAYIVSSAKGSFVVEDGVAGKIYNDNNKGVLLGDLQFSSDSQHLAYAVRSAASAFTVLDGKEGKIYDDVSRIVFHADNSSLIYLVFSGGEYFVVVGNEEGTHYKDQIGDLAMPAPSEVALSPDKKHIAYVIPTSLKNNLIVIDGQRRGSANGYIEQLMLSNDASLSYVVRNTNSGQNDGFVVIENNPSQYYKVFEGFLSGDGQHFAIVTESRQGKFKVVSDLGESSEYDGVISYINPTFSKDGSILAYTISAKEKGQAVVINGQESKFYESVLGPLSVNQDNSITYNAYDGTNIFVVTDKLVKK